MTKRNKKKQKEYLKPDEVNRLEFELEKDKVRKLQEKVAQLVIEKKRLEQGLISKDITLLEYQLNDLILRNKEQKREYNKFTQELKEIYNLPDKWGYDSDSGKIIIE